MCARAAIACLALLGCTFAYGHALVRTLAPSGVPVWLNEGLAVLFEARGTWTEAQQLPLPDGLPLSRLADSFERLSATEARMAYAQSAVAVRALIDQAGGPTLVALLRDIGRGDPFDSSFERRMLLSFEGFAATLAPSP